MRTRICVNIRRRSEYGTYSAGLTGDVKGDYGVTLSMISNACNPASNYLLSKPSTVPHPPTRATPQTTAILPIGSANYNTIASWIATGC